ncbi:hypothetical protein P43SY_010813 [Pythium insidiosum]|uniref:Uncharacterized protein n=1 Tax=Pythium insidiosum TaxID=114742 RepID=A0AAD5L899_PYTIN|nr:hypothetical protein ATCC90586_011744 [Pythium insidiosum]KAJ0390022.1 hypothetical protein P43SY_010813 [Pythium insidiosum]
MTSFVPVQFKSLETANAYIADQSLHWIMSMQRLREELRIVTRRLASAEAANEEMYKDREEAQSLCTATRARFIKFKHEQILHVARLEHARDRALDENDDLRHQLDGLKTTNAALRRKLATLEQRGTTARSGSRRPETACRH